MVLRLECVPLEASGMSSSTTTYSIAPAAKANRYGIAGTKSDANNIISRPPTGSTTPLNEPIRKDFQRLLPAARIGIAMIAPSGMFWIAIPIDIASAPIRDISACPPCVPAKTTPTAIPSGRLWIVTANTSIAVREKRALRPSGLLLPTCRCGVSSSISKRKIIPDKNPKVAGITCIAPSP